jgi:hypothetical protein
MGEISPNMVTLFHSSKTAVRNPHGVFLMAEAFHALQWLLNGSKYTTGPERRRQYHRVCLMVRFQTKNTNLDKFWRVLVLKGQMLLYFMAIWPIWYIFSALVCCTKKNLATLTDRKLQGDQMSL